MFQSFDNKLIDYCSARLGGLAHFKIF
jgi:hypothetical protein